jgi:hypothetical protein
MVRAMAKYNKHNPPHHKSCHQMWNNKLQKQTMASTTKTKPHILSLASTMAIKGQLVQAE